MNPASPPISSLKNPRVQFVRQLLTDRDARHENQLFVVEGIRLAEEAAASRSIPRTVFYSSQIAERGRLLLERFRQAGVEVLELFPDVLQKISDTEAPQGILLVMPQVIVPAPRQVSLALVLDRVRDPGNVGTILRTAAATGVQLVFFTPGSADPFMPKVVRAGMGAHFRFNIQMADWPAIAQFCHSAQPAPLKIVLSEASDGQVMWQADLHQPLALVVGGEAEGASDQAERFIDSRVQIPMPGSFESLNAGVAASILLYEILRQRQS